MPVGTMVCGGVPLAGVGTMGRPLAEGPIDKEHQGCSQTFPGVHLPLLWGMPQQHEMGRDWQQVQAGRL